MTILKNLESVNLVSAMITFSEVFWKAEKGSNVLDKFSVKGNNNNETIEFYDMNELISTE